MTCKECKRNMTDYIDERMEQTTRSRFERHLAICDDCRAERDSLLEIKQLLGGLQVEPLPTAFEKRIKKELFQINLKRAITPPVILVTGNKAKSRSKGRGHFKALPSIAAALLIGVGVFSFADQIILPALTEQGKPEVMMSAVSELTKLDQNAAAFSAQDSNVSTFAEESTLASSARDIGADSEPTTASAPASKAATAPKTTAIIESANSTTAKAANPPTTLTKTAVLTEDYMNYAYQIEQKLIGYQYKLISFDKSTGEARMLIIKDKAGKLINRELVFLCQGGRITTQNDWIGLTKKN